MSPSIGSFRAGPHMGVAAGTGPGRESTHASDVNECDSRARASNHLRTVEELGAGVVDTQDNFSRQLAGAEALPPSQRFGVVEVGVLVDGLLLDDRDADELRVEPEEATELRGLPELRQRGVQPALEALRPLLPHLQHAAAEMTP